MKEKKFLIYKSSAGSGKTHNLVKQYIKLIIQNTSSFRNILAITFTNKASDEMKHRVLMTLEKLTTPNKYANDEKIQDIITELMKDPKITEEIIINNSKNILKNILHNYSDFAICTIDSFVYKIIKTFSTDLYIPSDFEVELDTDDLIDKAIDLLISNTGLEVEMTKVLIDFIERKADEDSSWHIENDLKVFSKKLLDEESQIYLDEIKHLTLNNFDKIIKKLYIKLDELENNLKGIAKEAVNVIKSSNLEYKDFSRGNYNIGPYFDNIANENYSKIEPTKTVLNTVEKDEWYTKTQKPDIKAKIDDIKEDLIVHYKKISDLRLKYCLFKIVVKNIYPVALLNEIKQTIGTIKEENNFISITEFNPIIHGIIINQPVPYIYERLGEKFKHLLIDEFQDTSVLQWQNLLPLIHNSLSDSNFNFIVGDAKQAIYRWRNGEVEQIIKLPELIDSKKNPTMIEWEDALKRNCQFEVLNVNYRSRKEIVEFNNKLFNYLSDFLDVNYKELYNATSLNQQANKGEGGYIEVDFIEKAIDDMNYEELCLDKIKEIISSSIADNFSYRDISLLCRSNFKASQIAQYLMKKGVPVVSSESLLLAGFPVVNFLINCLRFIYKPNDNISKTAIISYIINDIKKSGEQFNKEHTYIVKKLNNINIMLTWLKQQGYEFDYDKLSNTGLYDICEELVRIFKLNDLESEPAITFFLDAVHTYLKENPNNIAEFLECWENEKGKISIVVPDEHDAVKILTIHKSKGLQFPIVIYPFATEKVKNTKDWLWVNLEEDEIPELKTTLLKTSKDIVLTKFAPLYEKERSKSYLDLLNLLYVVNTRAEERLYVLTAKPAKTSTLPDNIPAIFTGYFNSLGIMDESKNVYTFGSKIKYDIAHKKKDFSQTLLGKSNSTDWRQHISLRTMKDTKPTSDDFSKKIELGNFIHYVLSKIKYAEDAENIFNKMFTSDSPEINIKLIKKLILKLITNPETNRFFNKEKDLIILTETNIITIDENKYRPDRMIIKDKNITIIDYKTGKAEESHKKQLIQYSDLLKESGYENIEKYIIYIQINEKEENSDCNITVEQI